MYLGGRPPVLVGVCVEPPAAPEAFSLGPYEGEGTTDPGGLGARVGAPPSSTRTPGQGEGVPMSPTAARVTWDQGLSQIYRTSSVAVHHPYPKHK